MNKKIANIIGSLVGVIIIIIGFCVMNPATSLLGARDSLGALIKFGADFYTEIYYLTYQVGNQVQEAYVNICNAIGWLIVVIGLVDIAYFVSKMAPNEDDGWNNPYNVAPVSTVPAARPFTPGETNSFAQQSTYTPVEGEWKCTCGKIHKDFESSCVCGVTKKEAKAAQKQ